MGYIHEEEPEVMEESRSKRIMNGFLCSSRAYEYGGWHFEWHYWIGPWPLKKDGDPRKRAGRKFYKDIDEFIKMDKEQREEYRVGGGCQEF